MACQILHALRMTYYRFWAMLKKKNMPACQTLLSVISLLNRLLFGNLDHKHGGDLADRCDGQHNIIVFIKNCIHIDVD